VNVLPATVNVPVREPVPVLVATLKVTGPFPLPLAPALMVIHAALLEAVQVQPVDAVTVTVPELAPDATLADIGEIVGAHVVACVTVKVLPAIVSVPVRLVVPVLAATLKVTVPPPVPAAPAVTVIHTALLTAVHVQPAAALTVVLTVPPAAVNDWLVGEIAGAHGAVNEKVFERALAALPPAPTAETTVS
jgi:hypothetical protein